MADDSGGGNITIELNLETGQFTSNLNAANDKLKDFGGGGANEKVGESGTKFLELNAILEIVSKGVESVKMVWETLVVSTVEAAMKHEQAINQMNSSLAANGLLTDGMSEHIEKYAENLSRTTVIGEEQTNQAYKLAAQYAKNGDQLDKLAQAALNYSTATGKDMTMAMRALGGSLDGANAGLNRMLPGFKNMGSAALSAGAAIDEINRRYSGAAAAQAQTFTGRITMMKNAWEELHVSIGNAITQSPEINKIIDLITKAIHSATDAIKSFVAGGGIEKAIQGIINLGLSIAKNIVAPLEIVSNVGKVVFDVLRLSADGFIALMANVGNAIVQGMVTPLEFVAETAGKIVGLVNKDLGKSLIDGAKNIGESIKSFTSTLAASSTDVLKEHAEQVKEDMKNIFDTSLSDKAIEGINSFAKAIENASKPAKDLNKNIVAVKETGSAVGLAFKNINKGFEDEAIETSKAFDKNFQAAGKAMLKGIGSGAANAFASFGKAIAEGKDALSEFGKAFLAAIGNTCVSLGTSFVMQAAAMAFSPNPQDNAKAPGLLATGAALAAFGGLLSGMGGGGNSSYAATSSGGGSATSGSSGSAGTTAVSSMQTQQSASIVINGDFLNSSETANHLTQILRQNSDTTNYTITAQGVNYS